MNWLDAQLVLIQQVGVENYLAQQIGETDRLCRHLPGGNTEVLAEEAYRVLFIEPRVSPDGKTTAALRQDNSHSFWWVPAEEAR